HLLDDRLADRHMAAAHHLQAARLGARLLALVRLQVADRDIAAGVGFGLALLQHPVGLADPRGHAEEDLVAARGHGARLAQAPSRLCTTRSISLMPTKGATKPPSP